MYIKSITLEGFKSYGQRTNIDGFDPFFNAITGLNGSGKSNILDGICFLLGISNLSQVRAANLQELVYKNGQAGISKASVSITFDNTDKNQTPVGYGDYTEITVTRQVVIGGRNKYLINGCNAQNTRVQDLFRSVQMNVNNPHFLIMQGRVTKVLNMKPPEILSMIEEAAGTKMYETKKQDAQRKIENKDTKLRDIETILKEDITPTLDKLRHERETYLEYQKIERELEYITKLCVAHQYITEEELTKTSKADLEKRVKKIQELKDKYVEAIAELKEMDNIITTLESQRTAESGNVLQKFQSTLIAVEKDEAKVSSNLTSKQDCLNAERLKAADLKKQQNEDAAAVDNKATELEGMMTILEKIREESTRDAEMAVTARARFQAASSGLSTNDQGQAATLAEQLMSAKNEVSVAETESKQAALKLRHSELDLQKMEVELTKTANEYKKDAAALKPLEDAVNRIEANLSEMGYDENAHQMLLETQRGLQREATGFREKLQIAESRFPQTAFEYSDPQPNFDRSKVKGLVCTLFKVKDPQYATALEVISGGKLYNVVVDNETTGKLLLERGNLRKRHTIIPLNKIEGRPITQDVLHRAQQLVGFHNVRTALSLVDYDRSLQSAMEFVFGNTLVCSNMDTAKRVTYDRAVFKKTVTLEGELFDPAGTLSGGSRKPGAPVLLQLTDLTTMKQQLKDKLNELKRAENNLAQVTGLSNRCKELRQQLELKQREVNLVNQRLQNSDHHKQLEEVKLLKQNIEEQHEILRTCSELKKKAEKRVAELEEKLQNVNLYLERELKEAEQNAAQCQKQAEISTNRMKEKQQEVDVLKLEAEELKNGLLHYDEQLEVVNKAIADYEKEKADLEDELNRIKEEVEKAKEGVRQQKELLRSADNEIAEMHRKQEALQRETEGTKLKTKEFQLELAKIETTSKEAAQRLKALQTKFQWILAERKYFGQPNSVYDFQANDPIEAKHRLHKLHSSKEKLSKNVNMRAMTLLGETEKQFNDLIKKKGIVENDKKKIAAAIQELDEKKKETLHAAWLQVNKDFGSIFSSLLPGTQAKLLPSEGKTVLDGLEFKVAFGNKWKESLNELSGGQRSLVALSLILAMLRFKAAPIYILDEVDAALDLSHTQNIGSMLRTHFKNSQFIIVSLKDGMFNNANVLFKTKFVDGMSTVSRHTPTS